MSNKITNIISTIGLTSALGFGIGCVPGGGTGPVSTNWYADNDGDTYGAGPAVSAVDQPNNHVANNSDCNDNANAINPGAEEVLDSVDNDCDGVVDAKYVFVTSSSHSANLGGLAGADDICQGLADASSLPSGEYKAWLSDDSVDAASRLTHSAVPLLLSDHVEVAANWTALTSVGPLNTILLDEAGVTTPVQVWTGTDTDGTAYYGWPEGTQTAFCENWTYGGTDPAFNTVVGNSFTPTWTVLSPSDCDGLYHFYCFQQ